MAKENKEYLELLNKLYLESSSQFDKQVLYFASGALGLSFAFIKDIVKLDNSCCKNLLILSWVCFGIVILISILSHYTSARAINNKIENINITDDKASSKFNSYTKRFNILMMILNIMGLAFLIVFIWLNI